MNRWIAWIRYGLPMLLALGGFLGVRGAQEQPDRPDAPAPPPAGVVVQDFVDQYCLDCHSTEARKAGLALDTLSLDDVSQHAEVWENVVRKLVARHMPPARRARPDERTYNQVVTVLAGLLDDAAARHPDPGRTDTFRRLNRTEYQNAIRDLLALDVDTAALLPNDESSQGFDNITVGDLSPTLLDRYITAAQRISRLAVGTPGRSPGGDTFRFRADLTQEEHVEGLPFGTRGGALIAYQFPQDGEYEIQAWLTRDRNEQVEGLKEPHELEFLLDRQRQAIFTLTPPANGEENQTVDEKLKTRIRVTAGPHQVGVTFLKNPSSLLETKRQPYQAHFNMHRHPRITPALYQVSITGPYAATSPGDTPSRRRVFVSEPPVPGQGEEEACARRILSTLIRRAYRRPATDADLQTPLAFYRNTRAEAGFDAGIEAALSAILVNPQFLFRVERDPPGVASGTVYRLSDLELASRLAFFVWSSIPDDELLDLAARGVLSRPGVLEAQARRLLADPRAHSLVSNFASQWLHLRNLDSITPDLRLFPDFDDNLRQAFRAETSLMFESVLREDRSVLDLLKADHTFLNERLARHYGIPHVYGSHFRRVPLEPDSVRGGLLRQGSILTVTSYATRTSPVIRGKWVLENILGTPPPPPPGNVPALKDNTVSSTLSVRERLAEHRASAACASCHNLMDPVGLALENFDAVGRWRTVEEGKPIDATGGLPDGSTFAGVAGLEQALLDRPELFVGTLAEKLLTFALGRGVEHHDAPAIRKIVRDARSNDYRLSSLVVGVATSTPFQMRRTE
jgi:hypothetical protein